MKHLTNTPFYTEFSEPLDIVHLLQATIGSQQAPVGLLTFGRAAKSGAFGADEGEFAATLRDAVQDHLRMLLGPLGAKGPVDSLATTIAATSPRPLFLFDKKGVLRWWSRTAEYRLGKAPFRSTRCFTVGGDWHLVDALQQCAKSFWRPGGEGWAVMAHVRELLQPSERLLMRKDATYVMFEIVREKTEPLNAHSRLTTLTPMELRVAQLRADGYSVTNIAHRLGRSENTIHTHLKRVRQKLQAITPIDIRKAIYGE